jgi:CheY-like chemotaxis protein
MNDPAHVLIADDVAELREVLRFHLEHSGFAVSEAGTGRETIAEVERDCPDVLVLDVTMPDMDGWAVLKQLRHDPEAAGMRIAVLTGDANEMTEQRALCAGALAFIAKPVSPADLTRVVDRLLGMPARWRVAVA